MSFSTRLANYTNTTGENSADALKKGVDYTIGIVNSLNPSMLRLFSYKRDLGTSDGLAFNWVDALNASYLIDVFRDEGDVEYTCRPVSEKMKRQLSDTSSIYYTTYQDPVYLLDDMGKVTIKPTCSATNAGYITIVPSVAGRTVDDANETIKINAVTLFGVSNVMTVNEGFPVAFQELMILHAAECMLMERLVDFRAKLPTDLDTDTTLFDQLPGIDLELTYTFPSSDYQDALDKAQKLIDDGANIGGDDASATMSVQYWLDDEDEDMVQVTLGTAAQELQRASAILAEFNAEINAQVQSKGQDLQAFQANLQKKLTLYDKIISKLNVDYGWMTQQLQLIGAKKQEFIQSQIGQGPTGSPAEGKVG
tara:strand:- start:844 stop:1941 length:1098 start_codon:yes stop_codon:yes gene_type:complete